jgi:anti-sigma B factor antagonist
MKHVDILHAANGRIDVVTVSGFMDMAEVPKFEKVLDQLIAQGRYHIALDLSDLTYVSSAGLGAIIGRIREVRRHGGDIKVGGYSGVVFDILKTFGFTEVFETYDSCAEAIKKFEVSRS